MKYNKCLFGLLMGLLVFSLHAGDFYLIQRGEKEKVGTFDNQQEFVRLLKIHMASEEQLKIKKKQALGIMYFVQAVPEESIEGDYRARIFDFYKYPEKYGFVKYEGDRLYDSLREASKSETMKREISKHGFNRVYIISVEIKSGRLYGISESNEKRIYLDPYFE